MSRQLKRKQKYYSKLASFIGVQLVMNYLRRIICDVPKRSMGSIIHEAQKSFYWEDKSHCKSTFDHRLNIFSISANKENLGTTGTATGSIS